MKWVRPYILSIFCFFPIFCNAQDTLPRWDVKGLVSTYGSYNFNNDLNFLFGGNFLPEVTYEIPLKDKKLIDFDLSANMYGSVHFHPFDTAVDNGDILPYRAWGRYSGRQFEFRLGLQKINFGSATSLRPLRWFDQVDPRDPLQLTTGVYGALGRYYFLNNANIWAWVLYGNEDRKGWEQTQTYEQIPEFGGRFQFPVPRGEMGISYHHRLSDSRALLPDFPRIKKIPENRIGLDGKWDLGIGLWFETSYTRMEKNIDVYTHQGLYNIGLDYTFGIGNGINLVGEHMIVAFDRVAFAFENPQNLTAVTASYPIGLFDNLSTVLYYDWGGDNFYTFLNYKRELKYFTLYVMVFLNPSNQGAIQENDLINSFAGKGTQLMLVYNF